MGEGLLTVGGRTIDSWRKRLLTLGVKLLTVGGSDDSTTRANATLAIPAGGPLVVLCMFCFVYVHTSIVFFSDRKPGDWP